MIDWAHKIVPTNFDTGLLTGNTDKINAEGNLKLSCAVLRWGTQNSFFSRKHANRNILILTQLCTCTYLMLFYSLNFIKVFLWAQFDFYQISFIQALHVFTWLSSISLCLVIPNTFNLLCPVTRMQKMRVQKCTNG